MLGELECRKHLSGLPESQLAAHISQLIDVLLSIALGLIRARHFCVALHPVWPILAWSRDAVKAFNDQLASKVSTCCHMYTMGALPWLWVVVHTW